MTNEQREGLEKDLRIMVRDMGPHEARGHLVMALAFGIVDREACDYGLTIVDKIEAELMEGAS